MPIYDYLCASCGHRFEVVHGVHGAGPESCPNCGRGPVRKAISAPAIHYRGSGWAKKERRATVAPAKSGGSDSGSGSSGGSAGDADSAGRGTADGGGAADSSAKATDAAKSPSADPASAPAAAKGGD